MPVGIHPGPADPYAGRMATEARRRRLAQIDRQLAARRPLRDPWDQMAADERDHEQTLLVGHRQRLAKAEHRIMVLERLGRVWWTPEQTNQYVKACRDRDASKEWLAAYESGNHGDNYGNL
jgi:hypothetical protein